MDNPQFGLSATNLAGGQAVSQLAAIGDSLPFGRGSVLGRYTILSHLGSGGMGSVFIAHDSDLDRKVALKLVRSDLAGQPGGATIQARLVREAKSMARVSHPNILTVYDVGIEKGHVLVTMEYIHGVTLKEWLSAGSHPRKEVLTVFLAAGRGLSAAHGAGLIHRDFKPANVLIGNDGRVLVADFGLARSISSAPGATSDTPASPTTADDLSASPAASPSALGPPPGIRPSLISGSATAPELTAVGTVLGTPAYMPPEQFRGQPADERSDQFSFCVALYEALYKERPFADPADPRLLSLSGEGAVRGAPPKSRVPSRLRQVLLRGLRPDPRDRYPSMSALLLALEHVAGTTRRILLQGVVLVLATAAAIGTSGAVHIRRERIRQCQDGERQLAGVWDPQRSAAIEASLLHVHVPYVQATWQGVRSRLDQYTSTWVAMKRESCEATRIHGKQSEALFDRRTTCLEQRLGEVRALLGVLGHADEKVTENALEMVSSLDSVEQCSAEKVMAEPVPPPQDPLVRLKVKHLREQIAEVRALAGAARYRQALDLALAAQAEAEPLGYTPILAELRFLVGTQQGRLGDHVIEEQTLLQAMWEAEGANDDDVALRAASRLVYTVGVSLVRYKEGMNHAAHAEAILRRSVGDPGRRATLDINLGLLLKAQGDYAQAAAHLSAAVQLLKRVDGEKGLRTATALHDLALVLSAVGQQQESERMLRDVLVIEEANLGEAHPKTASTLASLAGAYQQRGHDLEALELFERAMADKIHSLGPGSPVAALTRSSAAMALRGLGRYQEALSYVQQALETQRRALGPDHPDVGMTLLHRAQILIDLKRPDEALADASLGLDIIDKVYAADHLRRAHARLVVAEALRALDRRQEALGRADEAVRILDQHTGVAQPLLVESVVDKGELCLELHKNAEAVQPLQQAVDLLAAVADPGPRVVAQLAEMRAALSRAQAR